MLGAGKLTARVLGVALLASALAGCGHPQSLSSTQPPGNPILQFPAAVTRSDRRALAREDIAIGKPVVASGAK